MYKMECIDQKSFTYYYLSDFTFSYVNFDASIVMYYFRVYKKNLGKEYVFIIWNQYNFQFSHSTSW